MIRAVGGIAVQQRRLILVRDDHVQRAAIRQVGERDGAPVIVVRYAHSLRDVDPAAEPTIEIDA